MAHPKKYLQIKELALRTYKELGPMRSLQAVRKVLSQLGTYVPSMTCLKQWSRENGWVQQALDHDRETHKLISEFPASPEGIATRRTNVFHAREELTHLAELLVNRVVQWSEKNDGVTCHVTKPSDAKYLVESAIMLVKEAEVLAGRVSDRVAEEKKVTQAEVDNAAQKKTDVLAERITLYKKKFNISDEEMRAAH